MSLSALTINDLPKKNDVKLEYLFGECPDCKIPLDKSIQCSKCHKLSVNKNNYEFDEIRYACARTNKCECNHCISVKLLLIYGDDEADIWGPNDPLFLEIMGQQSNQYEKSLDDQIAESIAADIFDESDHVKLNPLDMSCIKKMQERIKLTDKKLSCSICLEDITKNQKLIKLPCFHRYHAQCLLDWFKYQDWCPYCHKLLRHDD
jgi:hypothetical protein